MDHSVAPLGISLVMAIQICIALAAVLALLFHKVRQPALLAYILAGLLLGFLWRHVAGGSHVGLAEVSHLGLTLLLFIIGLELDLEGIFRLGPRAAAAVLLQTPVAIAFVLGAQWLAHCAGVRVPGLGTSPGAWFVFAVATALSSTAVVVRLLADRFDLTSEAGKLTVLTLIGQDIWAVLALSYVNSSGGAGALGLLKMFGGATLVSVGIVVVARKLLSRVFASVARAPDLLAIGALAWCFVGTTAMSVVGLSGEMGALVAGLSLSVLPAATEILAKMLSLRDFFMAIFFVALGMSLPPPTASVMAHAAALTGIVILVRLVLFTPALLFARLGPVVSLVTPINLAQLSEFSLLLVAAGIGKGTLTRDEGSVISYAMMLSLLVASYGIKYNYQVAGWLAQQLSFLPGLHRGAHPAATSPGPEPDAHGGAGAAPVLILGYHYNAAALLRRLVGFQPDYQNRILVVDFNLKNHAAIAAMGLKVAYGDISNPETLRHLGITRAAVVIATLSDTFLRGVTNRQLVQMIRALNRDAYVVVTAESAAQAGELQQAGADACVCPPEDAVPQFLEQIEHGLFRHEQHT